jgi:hypothetical protein
MLEIKRLKEDTRRFEANGKTYVVHESLTMDAFKIYDELRVEMEAGNTVGDMLGLLKTAYELLNKNKLADAAVCIYNAINVSERIESKRPQAWAYALTLFVRPDGHDLTSWNEADALGWIEDWNAEGYAVDDLFILAVACKSKLDTGFLRSFPDTLQKESESGQATANG